MSDDRERELHMMLFELQRCYREAAQPIIDELVEIEARKPPRPMIIPMDGPVEPSAYVQELIRGAERAVKDACYGHLRRRIANARLPHSI